MVSTFKRNKRLLFRYNGLHDKISEKNKSTFNKNIETKAMVRVISFGYKNGLPREADIIFDMRFLKTPFYLKELRI